MQYVPRISRQLVIIICGIQIVQLLVLSSYTVRLAWNVKPFDSVSFFRGANTNETAVQPIEESKAYLLIPIHQPDLNFCRCLRTHLINGFSPILVNLGIDVGGDRANKYFKIRGVYNYIKRNPDKIRPQDVIAIVDGFDAFSQLGPESLLDHFRESGQKILAGTDKNCFPNDPNGPVCNDIPQSEYSPDAFGPDTDQDELWGDRRHTRPRWLNSGTIVGYFDALEELYDSMVQYSAPDDDHGSDQRIFAVHYYWGNFSLALDFKSRLAVSVAYAEWELDFMNNTTKLTELGVEPWRGTMPQTGAEITLRRGPVVHNRLMGTVPVFVHFPGVAKGLLEGWEHTIWLTTASPNATKMMTDYVMDKTVTVAENQKTYTFAQICQPYIRPWGGLTEPMMEPGVLFVTGPV